MPITLPAVMRELSSAEDFLDHFGVPYDPERVKVARLHILQRFHEYLAAAEDVGDEAARQQLTRGLLAQAYDDFVRSDPLTERVFKVLRTAADKPKTRPQRPFVPLAALKPAAPGEPTPE